ncbi:glutathione S-transferase domain-containing protein [Gonapodya prolifera JEL478]|uniref:Glutathione S-transferase domain-containing protein n=1 Tax=Gonapodya prolifera (strain JEL478) TaxID=1344416 RepID=A0A139AFD1_GONPJ|nr:glutathione S-transferase domain-containing protein [Gonapodya prolifera JEL478]|eukprot:KXS15521.1 glutathione S-transferase domain-containing protein [Gonapodya prolifera JEL478]
MAGKAELHRQPFTVYGQSGSGNCHKVTFVANLLSIPFTWTEIDSTTGQTRTPAFLAINPAGQVPCVVLADGRVLSQSNAIMLYLAEGSRLIPEDRFDRAQMYQWLFWEQYSHEPTIAVRRARKVFGKVKEEDIDPKLMESGTRALELMQKHLAGAEGGYFVGATLTLADIALVAYTRLAHEGGFDLVKYPAVLAWVKRVCGDLGVEYTGPV